MITEIQKTSPVKVKTTIAAPTIFGLLVALLSPTLLVLLSGYVQLGFIGGELYFWGIALAIVMVVLLWERKPLASIGFKRFSIKDAAWAKAMTFVIFLSFPAIYGLLNLFNIPVATDMAKALGSLPVPVLFLLALRAGVTEEIIYRGFLVERLLPITNSRVVAGFVPLLVFIISHLNWGMAHLVFVTIAGALLTLLYLWKRNLWLNIFCHFAVDLMLFLVLPYWL